MADKGILVFRGDSGAPESHYAKAQISEVTSAAALTTLGTALLAYTDANLAKESFVSQLEVNDVLPGAAVNVDLKGIVYFRDDTTLKVHSITIPAITSTAYEEKDQGTRVTAAAVSAIVALINTATGKTYTGLYGVVIKKR